MKEEVHESKSITIYCMYCSMAWPYTGHNFTNICCPYCKRRFNVTTGKAYNYNKLAYENERLKNER